MRRVKPYAPPDKHDLADSLGSSLHELGYVEQARLETLMWNVYNACEAEVEEASAIVKGVCHRQAAQGDEDDTN